MLAPRAFWYLRHGETDWNREYLAQGRTEVALNETGLLQARAAATSLQGRGISTIVTSPLSRARVTAEIVGEATGLAPLVDDGLIEAAYGDREGQPMSDWFDDWLAGHATPPGGESFAALRERARLAVNRCTDRPGLTLVVAHGALMRALRAEMGIVPNVRTPNAVPLHCAPADPEWVITPL